MRTNICFHGVGTLVAEREPGEAGYWITVDTFERILDRLPDWPDVLLSFDDGNRSDVDIALPRLLDRGLTATFFPLAGRIGRDDSLSADDIRELAASGMAIGTHGMHHRPWSALSTAEAHEEWVEARSVLSDVVGTAVTRAAFPLGRYDRRSLAALRRHGYLEVNTSDRRLATPGAWLQPRFSVRQGESVDDLAGAIARAGSPVRRVLLGAKGVAKRLR